MATVAEVLTEAIDEQDLTHTEAADRLGVSRQTLYGWLRGQQPSSPEHVDAIVGFTGTDKLTILLATGWLQEDDLVSLDKAIRGSSPEACAGPLRGPETNVLAGAAA